MESFGRYQLIRKLATGGMAEVWLAQQPGLEGFRKLVVVKRILPHLASNVEFVTMFLDEARVAARLNHPNVAQVFDLGKEGDSYFIAMEFIHGEDVRRVQRQADGQGTPLPLDLTCRVLIGACEGLHYAHNAKDPTTGRDLHIVHRDVSPQNILVTFDGGVKVVDFGIAKAADQITETRSGVLKGKYAYMSPEQAEGERLDARSDVFALGIVLWELATGERLFKRATEVATLTAVMKCEVRPPSAVNPAVPPVFDDVCLRALARDVADRTASCRELQVQLEEFLVEQKWTASSAHLAEFMHGIFAERLAEEERLGAPVIEADASSSSLDEVEPEPDNRTKSERHLEPASGASQRKSPSKSASRPVSSPKPDLLPDVPTADATRASRSGSRPKTMPTAELSARSRSVTAEVSGPRGHLEGPIGGSLADERKEGTVSRIVNERQRRRTTGLFAAALVVTALGGGAFWALKHSTPADAGEPRVPPVAAPANAETQALQQRLAALRQLDSLNGGLAPDEQAEFARVAKRLVDLGALEPSEIPVVRLRLAAPAPLPPATGAVTTAAATQPNIRPPAPLPIDTKKRAEAHRPPRRKAERGVKAEPAAPPGHVLISLGPDAPECEVSEKGKHVATIPGPFAAPPGDHVYAVQCGDKTAKVGATVTSGAQSNVPNPFR